MVGCNMQLIPAIIIVVRNAAANGFYVTLKNIKKKKVKVKNICVAI